MPGTTPTPESPWLVADVGGTNARFALVRDASGVPESTASLICRDYQGLAEAVDAYLGDQGRVRPTQAAIAVATAGAEDWVQLWNQPWGFSQVELRQRFGLQRLLVLNDFTALALSIPYLRADGVRRVGRGAPKSGAAIAVLGPGTGLGVSGLIPYGDEWQPLSGEGGHVSYGGMDEHENELLRIVRERYGHVSAERLLSGPGLVNLYLATAGHAGLPAEDVSPVEISGHGLQGVEPFTQVLERFCGILGTVAGNLALTLGAAGGVYIGGGIVPRLGLFLDRSSFRSRFEAHGRLSAWLETVPTYVIQAPNPALTGAARALFSS